MSRPMVRIHNIQTNEIIDREMNDSEYEKWQAEQTAEATRQAEAQAKAAQRQALLEKLGITEEEAQLLLS